MYAQGSRPKTFVASRYNFYARGRRGGDVPSHLRTSNYALETTSLPSQSAAVPGEVRRGRLAKHSDTGGSAPARQLSRWRTGHGTRGMMKRPGQQLMQLGVFFNIQEEDMFEQVPQELKRLNQWVCWRAEPDVSRPGKMKKVPVNPRTGGLAMSNNPGTWTGFEQAVKASHSHSGIGFMFANGYFGVDIDNIEDAINDFQNGGRGNIAAEFIGGLQSYAEVSVSGKGLHILCRGALPKGGRRRGNVEMYDSARFFVVTGRRAGPYDAIADCTERIRPLHQKYIGGGKTVLEDREQMTPLTITDEKILNLARKAGSGRLFTQLYAGHWEGRFPSQSEADLALCVMLAFWCKKDEQAVDRLFRLSGLMRDKWDRKQAGSTYGALTVAKAVQSCRSVYQPKEEFAVRIGPEKGVEKPMDKRYSFDDTGSAERFCDRFGTSVLYNYTAKKWMYYDGRRWGMDDSGEVKRMADQVVKEAEAGLFKYLKALPDAEDKVAAAKEYAKYIRFLRSSRAKTNMLLEAQHRVPVNTARLDTNKTILCTLNGELDLIRGQLLPHDSGNFNSKLVPYVYKEMPHPNWDRFLLEVFAGDTQLIRYVQRAVGYSLTGETKEHCAFILYGTGRNGKSTFVEVIAELMGDYAANIQPETILIRQSSGGPTSDIARLKGVRFVTTSEPNEGMRLNEGLFKQLTGGDRVTASLKYENEFEFTPEFKLWVTTNHKPEIRGTDDGIWSRIHLIPFEKRIPDHKMDKDLKAKLLTELPGILHWAVQGCLAWQREGLNPPEKVLSSVREYKSEMDVLAAFVEEACGPGGEAAAGELFNAYRAWAQKGGGALMTATRFGLEMQKRYEKRKSGGIYYTGLHLKAAQEL